MSDERLILITDSSGASLKRWSLSMRSLKRVVGVAVLVGIGTLGALLHSVYLHDSASKAALLAAQNQVLQQQIAQLQRDQDELRSLNWKLSAIKERLWGESSLDTNLPLGAYLTQLEANLAQSDEKTRALTLLERDFLLYQRQAFQTLSHFKNTEVLLNNTPSLRPARSPWVTSRFGLRRDPVSGKPAMHKGLDLGGYTGMPIIAPADGKVVYSGMRGAFGITVVLDHGFGLQTHFGHLSATHVEYGESVKRGATIAEMGSTGKSTGPHLHYEVRRWGLPLDPEPFMLD